MLARAADAVPGIKAEIDTSMEEAKLWPTMRSGTNVRLVRGII